MIEPSEHEVDRVIDGLETLAAMSQAEIEQGIFAERLKVLAEEQGRVKGLLLANAKLARMWKGYCSLTLVIFVAGIVLAWAVLHV